MMKEFGLGLAVAMGFVVGIGLQRIFSNSEEGLSMARQSSSQLEDSQSEPKTRSSPATVRPSLDEILAASDVEAPVLVSRYLRDVTIDDVITLLRGIYDRPQNRSFGATTQLAIKRGVELDPLALIEAVHAYPHESVWMSDSQLAETYRAWSVLDPEAALTASTGEIDYLQRATIEAIADQDPEAALAMAQSRMPYDEELLKNVRKKYLSKLAATDVQAALEQATSIKNSQHRYQALSSVVQAWAGRDPFEALDWVNANDDVPNRAYLLEVIFGYAAKEDPAAAERAIESAPPAGSRRFQLVRKVVAEWAAIDPAKAVDMIRSTSNAQQRAMLFESYITQASPNSDEVLQLLSDLEISITENHSHSTSAAVRRAFAEIAKESPGRALQQAMDTLGIGSMSFETAVRAIAEDSASTNPTAAAEWAFGLPKSKTTERLQNTVLRKWLDSAPEDVAKFLETNEMLGGGKPSRRGPAELEQLTRSWAKSDAPALLNWAANLAPENRENVLAIAVQRAAWHNPAEATKFIDLLSTSRAQSLAISAVAGGLQQMDPMTAVEWLATLPAEHNVGKSLAQSAGAAVLANPQAASQQISELPTGLRRDQAITGMVDALLSSENPSRDLSAAAEWASTIADPDLQNATLRRIEKSIPKEK